MGENSNLFVQLWCRPLYSSQTIGTRVLFCYGKYGRIGQSSGFINSHAMDDYNFLHE